MTDFSHVRQDFSVLTRLIHGRPLVFLDSAASSQKPTQVLDVMDTVYRTYYANVHRGAYLMSEESTTAYEDARGKVARFIKADSPSDVVFTRGATTALNMVAFGWGMDHLGPGDKILLTIMEHHANLVPWQMVARRTGAELVYLPMNGDYRLDIDRLPDLLDEHVKVLSMTGMSNVTGTLPPVAQIARMAREHGAIVGVDAAQLITHAPVDVQQLEADFVAFSGHKMLGPTGIGGLWARPSLLEEMEPFEGGGEMISDVQLDGSTWAPVPHKFEAGTPPIVEAIGLGAAVDYLENIGMESVRRHGQELTSYALTRLMELPAVRVFGPADLSERGGVISFALGDVHPHDVATILDQEGVAVRAGHHCAKPLTRALGVSATVRASFQVYNNRDDVDALVAGLRRVQEVFDVD